MSVGAAGQQPRLLTRPADAIKAAIRDFKSKRDAAVAQGQAPKSGVRAARSSAATLAYTLPPTAHRRLAERHDGQGEHCVLLCAGRFVADHNILDHHRGLRQLGHQLSASFRLPRPLVGAPSRFRLGLVTPSRLSRFPSVTLPLSPSPAWAALGRALNARFDDSTHWALAAALTACQPDLIPRPRCAHPLAAECSTGREHVPRPFEQAEPRTGAAVQRASQVDTASGARLRPSASG